VKKLPILLSAFCLAMPPPIWADTCAGFKPKTVAEKYVKGPSIKVAAGIFSFDLPRAPSTLVATNGALAKFENGGYVGYQYISSESIADHLATYEAKLSAADLYGYIYGVQPTASLSASDKRKIQEEQQMLKLNCASKGIHASLGNGIDKVMVSTRNDRFDIVVVGNGAARLINVKGTEHEAMSVFESILFKEER
jgi:hypothetical protein